MLRPQEDIYLTLPSNLPGVAGNKPSNYKTVLPTHLKLNGAWEVALLETHYPHQIPNFKATTLVVIATETAQNDQPKPQPNLPQVSKFPMPHAYWQQPEHNWQEPQPPRAQAQRDVVDGHWPSGEDEEDLIIDRNDESSPQPQTAAASTAPKEDEKKSEPLDVEDPEPAKSETPAVDKPKEDTKKPEDAKKTKTDEDLAKRQKRMPI